jgi:hypothetical protein
MQIPDVTVDHLYAFKYGALIINNTDLLKEF